jgi:hypothetical protein
MKRSRRTHMAWARAVYRWLIWLFLLGIGIQFLLAGLGTLGGESIEPHEELGRLLLAVSLILVVLAAIGRLQRPIIPMTVVLLILTGLEMFWAGEDLDPRWLRSFHVLGAFLIAGLSQNLAMKVGFPLSPRS